MIRQYLTISLLAMFSALALPSCGVIPLNSSANEPVPAKQAAETKSENYQFSGAFVASDQVPWWIPAECRETFDPAAVVEKHADANRAWPKDSGFWDDYCFKQRGMNRDEDFIALALSGGGMRAAVFASAVMFELEKREMLRKVDAISSVSGGSIAAALYALSCDDRKDCPPTVEGTERCLWREKGDDILQCGNGIFSLLDKNLELAWIGNLFWPDNVIRYWFTDWDRSDIMAETMADNLFDTSLLGGSGFLFRDLNPRRPSLVINATNIANDNKVSLLNSVPSISSNQIDMRKEEEIKLQNHLNFRFTDFNFGENGHGICSDLNTYPIANAVMASSAFPAVFQSVTLTDYCKRKCEDGKEGSGCKYKHLFDGGNSDNLGLLGLKTVLKKSIVGTRPHHIIIFQVDATLGLAGRPAFESDPRTWVDYFIDTNVIDTTDTLMATQYLSTEKEFDDSIKYLTQKKDGAIRIQLSFRKLQKIGVDMREKGKKNNNKEDIRQGGCIADHLWSEISEIGTRLKIGTPEVNAIREAAKILVNHEVEALCRERGTDFNHICKSQQPISPKNYWACPRQVATDSPGPG